MIRKAPFIEIDPGIENILPISGDLSTSNNGSTFLNIPANVFYNKDGTQYTGLVSMSLTVIDTSVGQYDAPGEFVTLNSDGRPEILATLGVFSIEFKDFLENQLLLNKNIEVFSKGPTTIFALGSLTRKQELGFL